MKNIREYYNLHGKLLKPVEIELQTSCHDDGVYLPNGTIQRDKNGYPVLKCWRSDSAIADNEGFDKRFEISNTYLEKGTVLCRYGTLNGRFSAPVGTNFDFLGLPYIKETMPYNEFLVVKDGLEVQWFVLKGIAAPAFESIGGAIQYWHLQSLENEIEDGYLEEVDRCLWQVNKNASTH